MADRRSLFRRWTRDEIGEYHDGHDNSIYRDDAGWWLARAGGLRHLGPYKTLTKAKAALPVTASDIPTISDPTRGVRVRMGSAGCHVRDDLPAVAPVVELQSALVQAADATDIRSYGYVVDKEGRRVS